MSKPTAPGPRCRYCNGTQLYPTKVSKLYYCEKCKVYTTVRRVADNRVESPEAARKDSVQMITRKANSRG